MENTSDAHDSGATMSQSSDLCSKSCDNKALIPTMVTQSACLPSDQCLSKGCLVNSENVENIVSNLQNAKDGSGKVAKQNIVSKPQTKIDKSSVLLKISEARKKSARSSASHEEDSKLEQTDLVHIPS